MRIGTWNVDARWDPRHKELVIEQACDVWLLTEIPDRARLPGFRGQVTMGRMVREQRWAGVFARDLIATEEPDPATAAARIGEVTVWSSILPWPSCGPAPWYGESHNDRVRSAVASLLAHRPDGDLIWGGDWNHSLHGRVLGSREGRESIIGFVDELGLQVPSAELPHQIEGVFSIDHIAVPADWQVQRTEHVEAADGSIRLSDHDLYIVEVDAAQQ
ncbi:endonuclease/exonuclease/phosphatase family protein [Nitriliruptor alkaliphilus]|uniref:endonuclease/exonuclease/phosphatase family protein n=1 Tax=Nitriliruptor alkaliphilus TaxID=427918 RepID=UPI0006987D7D|nr:endonuclease/exonuclease/phosphatase family protein [Nitriliruptor alkaliphilus]